MKQKTFADDNAADLSNKTTWVDAWETCRKMGGRLLEINTIQSRKNNMEDFKEYFDVPKKNYWIQTDTKTPCSYTRSNEKRLQPFQRGKNTEGGKK